MTVCKAGYSGTIRPPLSSTSFVKREELRYKLPGKVSDYQLDHLLSLSLGGSPYDTRNLWMAEGPGGPRRHARGEVAP